MKNNNNNHNEKINKFGHNRFWATAQTILCECDCIAKSSVVLQ